MSLILCPECGHKISDQAATCPYCGISMHTTHTEETVIPVTEQPSQEPLPTSQQPKHNKGIIWLLAFIVALVLCIVAYMCWSNAAEEKLEMQRYEEAMLSTNVQDLKDYLVQFNNAPQEHRDSVSARLNLLTEEEADWANTVAKGAKNALQEFIKAHPKSLHRGEAEDLIDSIDYSVAVRKGTAEAFAEYLKMHSESRRAAEAQEFLDNKKASEATAEEKAMARDVCRRFLQAVNARNEEKLLGTVSDVMTSFLGHDNASKQEAVKGKAQMISTVSGKTPEAFDIEITRITYNREEQQRDMVFKITDKHLLSLTGGIVQGMSGSPIVQNGKLIGAVTHVIVNNPEKGYAIFAQTMYEKSSSLS